eukprot:m.19183 g.19183  ORF g.19183 m.19183 type:complete len:386 (-) comp3668_c0_seq1:140-1297(-)
MPRKRPKMLVEVTEADALLRKGPGVTFGEKLRVDDLEAEDKASAKGASSSVRLNEIDKTAISKSKHVYKNEYIIDPDERTIGEQEAAKRAREEANEAARAANGASAAGAAGAAASSSPDKASPPHSRRTARGRGKEPAAATGRNSKRRATDGETIEIDDRDSSPEPDTDAKPVQLTFAQMRAKEARERLINEARQINDEIKDADEGGPAADDLDDAPITLSILGTDGITLYFTIKRNSIFKILYRAYANVTGKNQKWIRIMHGDKRLQPLDTPIDEELDGNDLLVAEYEEDDDDGDADAMMAAGGRKENDTVIQVQNDKGEKTTYILKPDTTFEKLYTSYAEKAGCSVANIKLIFDDEIIQPQQTIVDLDIDPGDEVTIDVRVKR